MKTVFMIYKYFSKIYFKKRGLIAIISNIYIYFNITLIYFSFDIDSALKIILTSLII